MRKASTPALLVTLLLLAACSAGAQTQSRKARPDGPPPRIGDELDGTRWQAVSLDGVTVADPAKMTLDFLPSGDAVSGQAGCSHYDGPFASRADKVTMGLMRQSGIPCAEPETAQQQQLIDTLEHAWRAELGNGSLVLYDRQGREARFVPRPR